jgi:hypothetical protein
MWPTLTTICGAEIISDGHAALDPYILKRSSRESTYDLFTEKSAMVYSFQITRNNRRTHRRNGSVVNWAVQRPCRHRLELAPLWMDF